MKWTTASVVLAVGLVDLWLVARWWLRRRRRDDYDWPDRNIFIALAGLGVVLVLAALRIVTE